MILRIFSFISIFLSITISIDGQSNTAEILDDSLRLKSENPYQFAPRDIAMAYYHWAGRQARKGIDSSFVAFDSMINFGKKHQLEEVLSEGYYGLGSLNYMKKNYSKAKALTSKSLSLKGASRLTRMGKYTQLADLYGALGAIDSAYMCFDTLFQNKELLKQRKIFISTYINYGKLLTRDNRYVSAIESFETALEMKDDVHSPLQIININNYISEVYIKINDDASAIEYLKRSEGLCRKNNYKSSLGKVLLKLGDVNNSLANYREAIKYFEEAISLFDGNGYSSKIFLCHIGLVESYLHLEDTTNARAYMLKSKKLYSEDHGLHPLTRYHLMMGSYKSRVNDESALQDTKKALVLAKSINNTTYKTKGYNNLILIYKNSGDYKKALLYSDSIKLTELQGQKDANSNYIYDYEIRYKKSLQDQELKDLKDAEAIAQLNLTKKNNQLLISLLGLLLAIVLGSAIFYYYRLKAKNNIILAEKNNRLSKALATNKMLIKEIHHRVKNNLQVVSSLLNLQSNYEKDEEILKAINTGKNRVQSMSLLHQNLYGNENLREINIKKYFKDLVSSLLSEYPLNNNKPVNTEISIDNLTLDIDTVVPLGLIVNELITNSLKYAYKNQEVYKLELRMVINKNLLIVSVADNGSGFPFDVLPESSTSMGTQLIRSFADKLEAEITINNEHGAHISLDIPLNYKGT